MSSATTPLVATSTGWTAISVNSSCVQYNAITRHPYEDISCLLRETSTDSNANPFLQTLSIWLSKSYQPWELEWNNTNNNTSTSTTLLEPPSRRTIGMVVLASGILMAWGKVYMHRRAPVAMRPLVTVWNCLWGLVTLLGFVRMAPLVVVNAIHYSLPTNVCGHASSLWTSGTTGVWGILWIYFKLVEVMVETLLVVLLKQPCGLLQWFNNYAYTLVHGYHLVTSAIPGGAAVIAIYYGIVSLMNAYCFHLNWNHMALLGVLPNRQQQQQRRTSRLVQHHVAPSKETTTPSPSPSSPSRALFLNSIHLVQTLSGVALSVVTLHYWKQAVYNNHHLHPLHPQYQSCHANEEHIRILAFCWSGGHVVVWAMTSLFDYGIARLVRVQQKEQRKLRRKHRKRNSISSKTVTFASTRNSEPAHHPVGAAKSKQDDPPPPPPPPPAIVDETIPPNNKNTRARQRRTSKTDTSRKKDHQVSMKDDDSTDTISRSKSHSHTTNNNDDSSNNNSNHNNVEDGDGGLAAEGSKKKKKNKNRRGSKNNGSCIISSGTQTAQQQPQQSAKDSKPTGTVKDTKKSA